MSWAFQPILAAAVQQAGNDAAYSLTASAGMFAHSGKTAQALMQRRLLAEAGPDIATFEVQGAPATFIVARRMRAARGAFYLMGRPVVVSGEETPPGTRGSLNLGLSLSL